MLDLLLAASLVMGDPCAVMASAAPDIAPVSCVVVDGPPASIGPEGVTLQRAKVQIVDTPDHQSNGVVSVKIAPAPTEGVYNFAAFPACEQPNGVLDQVGYGSWWYQLEGQYREVNTFNNDPYDDSYLAFTDDPCLSPAKRAVIMYGAYTSSPPNEHPEFESGNNSFGLEVLSITGAPLYGSQVGGSVQVTLANPCGVGTQNYTQMADCLHAAMGGRNWLSVVNFATEPVGYVLGQSNSSVSYINAFCPGTGTPRECFSTGVINVGVNTYAPFGYVQLCAGSASDTTWGGRPDSDCVLWHAQGSPERGEAGEPWEAFAYTLYSDVLDSVVYNPDFAGTPIGFLWPEGQCDSWSCLMAMCDIGSITELLNYLSCLVDPQGVDVMDMFDASLASLKNWGWWQVTSFGFSSALSFAGRWSLIDGACGNIGPPGGMFADLEVDTCALPMTSEIHLLLGAVVGIIAFLALVSWAVDFLKTGQVPNPFKQKDD